MKILKYQDWKAQIIDTFESQHQAIDCSYCGGSGKHECECNCPQCDNVVTCTTCNGDGHEYFNPITQKLVSKPVLTTHDYRKAVLRDLISYSKHTGKSQYKIAKQFIDNQVMYIGEVSWR